MAINPLETESPLKETKGQFLPFGKDIVEVKPKEDEANKDEANKHNEQQL
jgi:hypothetical protein